MLRLSLMGVSLAAVMASATMAYAQVKPEYLEFEAREQIPGGPIGAPEVNAPISFTSGGTAPAVLGAFQGISQYDVASVGRNFIPPDTMGAAGRTQFTEFVNGAVAVYDKATGVRTSFQSDVAFWAAAGQTGVNGDSRVLFDARSDKWVALAFGGDTKDIQIAVSATSDATGPWTSTKFEGYAGLGFGATADYPTMAIDHNALYIGTNNYAPSSAAGANNFRGTTLNVIPLSSLYAAGGPTTTGNVQFNTPYNGASPSNDFTRGFAIQGVNSNEVTTTGNIVAVSINDYAVTRYDILNAGTAGATRTAGIDVGQTYDPNDFGRQPSLLNPRVVDTLDDRIGASAWEVNGRIYTLHTVTAVGSDYTSVRYYVIDSLTNAVLDEGDIGMDGYDFYQGSLAVNSLGQVVIAYNRSGFSTLDGRISFLARTFNTDASGHLVASGEEQLLKVSDTSDYHNGSLDGFAAAGRQRWGDYSAVTLDPVSLHDFWVIGEYAREPNNAANGHPGGTGGTRWGTWIAAIGAGTVPEPSTWTLLIAGFGLTGAALRRRRLAVTA
ncbi:MAG: hypothetical protein JWQ29_1446 [Phenylobacterium sp.]|nr:hypothetical protein [Phenylobacterium sp.]